MKVQVADGHEVSKRDDTATYFSVFAVRMATFPPKILDVFW